MSVLKLRKKQRGPWCSYCESERNRAEFRGLGFTKFACQAHIKELYADDTNYENTNLHSTEAENSIGYV
ncbi:hypothetical protein [Lentilitoribacter sp. Alg239-R112]|uniref:hypothetical protein n=1 Tax=Lentilitoribacter sp. Alg239-R112 TaxID=2305987 RepID=UPI0013A6C2FC|nr:hypothetical protein [Lentilitoribacter sp. Alg239-R112]